MNNWTVVRILILFFVFPVASVAQGWEEITPPGFTGVTEFRSFEYQNGGYELFMWFAQYEPRLGLRLDETGSWSSISIYDSVLCDSVNMEYSEYELLDVGKSALKRNRTYSLYRQTGCISGSVVELYVDTTGGLSRQRLLASHDFPHAYGSGFLAVSSADSNLVFLRWSSADTLFISSNRGETFIARADPIPNGGGLVIYTSPFESNKIFAGDFDPFLLAYVLFVSIDLGITWSPSGPGDVGQIDFHPTSSVIAYGPTGGGDLSNGFVVRTNNGGASWGGVLSGDSLGSPGTVRFYSVEVHKDHPDTVYAGSNLKIYYTPDGGISWRIYNDTFPASPVIGIFQIPSTDTILVVTQGGVFRVYDSFVLDVDENESLVPTEFALWQNYPNPFNPRTVIKYELPVSASITLKVFDVLGNEVRTLVNESQHPGHHETLFDASSLASGVYFYRLTAGVFTDVKKLAIVK